MKTNRVTLSHDAFDRVEIVREKATGECSWCGQPARWRYGSHADDKAHAEMQAMVFCCRSCERAFNE